MEFAINPQTGRLDAIGNSADLSENQIDGLKSMLFANSAIQDFFPNENITAGKLLYIENKLYILLEYDNKFLTYDFVKNEVSHIPLPDTHHRNCWVYDGNDYIYIADDVAAILERVEISTGNVEVFSFANNAGSGGRNVMTIVDGILYAPKNASNAMNRVDLTTMTNLTDVVFQSSTERYVIQVVGKKMYLPSASNANFMDMYDTENEMITRYTSTTTMKRWSIAYDGNDSIYFMQESFQSPLAYNNVEKFSISAGTFEAYPILRNYRRNQIFFYENRLFCPIIVKATTNAKTERLMEIVDLKTKEVIYVEFNNFFISSYSNLYNESNIFCVNSNGSISVINLAAIFWRDISDKQNATDNSLQTTDKTVAGAINELFAGLSNIDFTPIQNQIDGLAQTKQDTTDNSLQTDDKTIAGAINEVFAGLSNIDFTPIQNQIDGLAQTKQDATDNSLQTTDTTVAGAINELVATKQDKEDELLETNNKTITDAINELNYRLLMIDTTGIYKQLGTLSSKVYSLEQRQNNFAGVLENPDDYDKFIPCATIYDEENDRYVIHAPNTNPELTFLQNAATVFDDINTQSTYVSFVFSADMNTEINEVLFRRLGNPLPDSINGNWADSRTLFVIFPTGDNALTTNATFQFDLSALQDSSGKSIANFDWKQTFAIAPATEPSIQTITLAGTVGYAAAIDGNTMYMPASGAATMLKMDLTTKQSSVVAIPNSYQRRCCAIYNNKLYMPQDGGYNLEVLDLTSIQTIIVGLPSNTARYTCATNNGYLYIPYTNKVDIIRMSDNSITTVTLLNDYERRWCGVYNNKLYMPANNGTTLDILDLSNNTPSSVNLTLNISRFAGAIDSDSGKLYLPQNNGTTLQIIYLKAGNVVSNDVLPASFNRNTCAFVNSKLYMPQYGGTGMQIYTSGVGTRTEVLPNSMSRYTSATNGSILYLPEYNGSTMEIINTETF